MRVALIDKVSNKIISKDLMGGYGAGNNSLFKLIPFSKKVNPTPSLSLVYLASIFSKDRHQVSILDREAVTEADIYIISSSIVDCTSELKFASQIKEKFSDSKIIFIGPFATYLSHEYLKVGDIVIEGEPEWIGMEISKGKIPQGLVHSQYLDNLDVLPFPNWDLFEYKNYSYNPILKKRIFLPIQSSRGCVFSCEYCPYYSFQKKWRARSINNVIDEIKYLNDKFKIKSLLFRDPLFTFDNERCFRICESMLSNSFTIDWACETRADLLSEDLINIMHRAGLRAINLGIETINFNSLVKTGRKKIDISYQEKIITYCEKKGIKIVAFFILGFPEDNVETIKQTIRYAKHLNTFAAQFCLLTPFPGTDLYKKAKKNIFETDWEKFDSFTPILHNPNFSPENLNNLREIATISYYFRFSYISKHYGHLFGLLI